MIKIFLIAFVFAQTIFAEQIYDVEGNAVKIDFVVANHDINDSIFRERKESANYYKNLLLELKNSEKIYAFIKKHSYAISPTDYLDQNIEGKWISANDGTVKFFTRSKNYSDNDGAIYEWNGSSFKNVIHGEGVLTRKLGNEVISEDVNAFFGSITSKDIINLPHGLYIGKLHDLSLDDFGVFLDSLCVYVGNFKNNLPAETFDAQYDSSWVCKENWLKEHEYGHLKLPQNNKYEGFIKNGKPDGFGKMVNTFETTNAFFIDGEVGGPCFVESVVDSTVKSGIKNEEKYIVVVETINKDDFFSQNIWKNGLLESVKIVEQINERLKRVREKKGNSDFEEYIFDGKLGDIYDGPKIGVFSRENLEENVHFVGRLSYLNHMIVKNSPCSIRFNDKKFVYQGTCFVSEDSSFDDEQKEEKKDSLSPERCNDEHVICEGLYEGNKYLGSVLDEGLVAQVQQYMAESYIDIRKETPRYHYRGKPNGLLKFSIDETVKSVELLEGLYTGGFDKDTASRIEGNIKFYDIGYGCSAPRISEGLGTLTAFNGFDTLFYMGDFSNGKFDGYGYLAVGDYFEYEGEFKNGKLDGFGKLTAKKITIPNLNYIDQEIKSIRGEWKGLDSLSQFFVVETVDGEMIDMVVENDWVIPVSKSELVKNAIGDRSIAKLVREHHGKITIALIGVGFGAGLICGIVSSSTAETGLVPCLAAVEGGVFALQSVVDGFVLYDKVKGECFGSALCKDSLLKEYAVDRIVDLGLTTLSVATGGIAGGSAKTAKVAKAANGGDAIKATKTANELVKSSGVAYTVEKISEGYVKKGKRICDISGKVVLDLSKSGMNTFEIAIKLIQKYGDDAIKTMNMVVEKNPEKLASALRYMDAKGVDGIYDVLKWQGAIPKWLTKDVIEVAGKIAKSSLKASVDAMKQLPGIRLSTTQLDMIRQTPSYMENLVKEMTGKEFRDGYLEFFIRLTKSNRDQAIELWNYSMKVRDYIKNKAIRPGKTHEWLMCENFMDFLTDPKWRKEGTYLAKALSVLVQKTDDVYIIIEDGTKWTHTMEKFGNGIIHDKIREVVKNSNSAEELLVNLEDMVRKNFPKEVYEKFANALADCFH